MHFFSHPLPMLCVTVAKPLHKWDAEDLRIISPGLEIHLTQVYRTIFEKALSYFFPLWRQWAENEDRRRSKGPASCQTRSEILLHGSQGCRSASCVLRETPPTVFARAFHHFDINNTSWL